MKKLGSKLNGSDGAKKGELVPYVTVGALIKALPTFKQQLDYQGKVAALRAYTKDPELRKAEIISQIALAKTLDAEVKKKDGAVKAVRNSKGNPEYVFANVANTPGSSAITRWRKLAKNGEPKAQRYFRKLESDKKASSISAAGCISWVNLQERRAMAAATAEDIDDDDVVVGDFREVTKDLGDSTAELVFTDPPWDRKSLEMYRDLGEMGQRVLCDGGSLLCYASQRMLPEAISLVCESGLTYYWICGEYRQKPVVMPLTGQKVRFIPILWFIKGKERFDTSAVIEDLVVDEGPQKDIHEWQQGIAAATHFIGGLTTDSGFVVDPFCGGGTTATAANKLGRPFFTCDIDKDNVASAKGRIHAENG